MTAAEAKELLGLLRDVETRLGLQPDAKAQAAFQARYYPWLMVVATKLAGVLARSAPAVAVVREEAA